jgi:hypothetical protein
MKGEVDTDGAACWQCGRPADPSSTYVRRLSRAKRHGADGQGFPVVTGWSSDTVRVPIPRCVRCRDRNLVTTLVIGAGFLIGGIVGGTTIPSRGWTTILGGFGTLVPLWFAAQLYTRWAGLRNVDAYPPVRRLREAGWSDPE